MTAPRHWKPLVEIPHTDFHPTRPEVVAETMQHYGIDEVEARALLEAYHQRTRYFGNNLYLIQVEEYSPGCLHLNIRRHDGGMFKDWRHFQQIKNEIAGEEREAVELYPAESRKVDTTNKWHLWVHRKACGSTAVGPSATSAIPKIATSRTETEAAMTNSLFPHQRDGADRLAQRTPTYLGIDMGIGKTRTFIEAVKVRHVSRVLVTCPASAVLVWKREIELWHINATVAIVRTPADLAKPANYYVVSHGLMSQNRAPSSKRWLSGGPST